MFSRVVKRISGITNSQGVTKEVPPEPPKDPFAPIIEPPTFIEDPRIYEDVPSNKRKIACVKSTESIGSRIIDRRDRFEWIQQKAYNYYITEVQNFILDEIKRGGFKIVFNAKFRDAGMTRRERSFFWEHIASLLKEDLFDVQVVRETNKEPNIEVVNQTDKRINTFSFTTSPVSFTTPTSYFILIDNKPMGGDSFTGFKKITDATAVALQLKLKLGKKPGIEELNWTRKPIDISTYTEDSFEDFLNQDYMVKLITVAWEAPFNRDCNGNIIDPELERDEPEPGDDPLNPPTPVTPKRKDFLTRVSRELRRFRDRFKF
jgi:hypothetical protein